MARRQAGSPDWQGIRRAFESGETITALARRFALHRSTISRHVRDGAWKVAGKAALATSAGLNNLEVDDVQPDAAARPCPGLATCFHRPALHARLYAGLERRINAFASARPGAVDADAKILTALVQTLQRLAALDNQLAPVAAAETSIDAAQIHEELARRLSRLADTTQEGPLSEGAE